MKAKSFGEARAILALAAILSFRMLGLFMIYPVFALYAPQYHYATPTLIGIALGAYGLTQALLQLPSSMLSDRIGRKPVIVGGLIFFLIGSLIAGFTNNIYVLILGRALQGAGAIGSAVMAFAADLTRVEHRTKAMAVLGMTIGLSFGAAMILGPIINTWLQLKGIFWLTAISALVGIFILYAFVPEPKKMISSHKDLNSFTTLKNLLFQPDLLRINLSIMILHAILTANFVVIPLLFKQLGILAIDQWHLYLPILLGAFLTVMPLVFLAEKRNYAKAMLLLGIAAMAVAEFCLYQNAAHYYVVMICLYLFFTGFTLLESLLPSLITKMSPANRKGSAMGVYSSLQFLGIFLGGWSSGLLRTYFTDHSVLLCSFSLCAFWLIIMVFMKKVPALKTKLVSLQPNITAQKAQQLITQLRGIPGVIDAEVSIEDCIAYLKIDHKILDQQVLLNVTSI
jgi:MFS family permease